MEWRCQAVKWAHMTSYCPDLAEGWAGFPGSGLPENCRCLSQGARSWVGDCAQLMSIVYEVNSTCHVCMPKPRWVVVKICSAWPKGMRRLGSWYVHRAGETTWVPNIS